MYVVGPRDPQLFPERRNKAILGEPGLYKGFPFMQVGQTVWKNDAVANHSGKSDPILIC